MNTERPAPEIAIIDPNTLACLGLEMMLEEFMPDAVIRTFRTFGDFIADTPDMYAHYFVSAQIYFEHTAFFLPRRPKAIVLAGNEGGPQLAGTPTLLVGQSKEGLMRDLIHLHRHGHEHRPSQAAFADPHDLTPREVEVLVLLTKGYINKEIADRLNISITTVISHRKNISEKLGIKSVAALAIYAVMNGYVEADSI